MAFFFLTVWGYFIVLYLSFTKYSFISDVLTASNTYPKNLKVELVRLLRIINLFVSFDKLDENKSNEIIIEILKNEELIKIDLIDPSYLIIFFLTNKFIRSKEFNEDWGKKENKAILIILLEEIIISSLMSLDLNDYFVIHFFNSMSRSEIKEMSRK